MKIFFSLSLLILLPHCMHINQKKSFAPVQEASVERISAVPNWKMYHDPSYVTRQIDAGLTLQDAIALGVDNNPRLQALFEEIGISKADLIQAGFYSNPHIETIFMVPKNDENRTVIELSASFRLSDLWQVPLRKKVAQDTVEVKTYEIVSELLQLRKEVQQLYVQCLYHQQHVQLVKEITHIIETIVDRINYRYQFGYATKLDKYFAQSKLAEWRAKIIDAQSMLDTAYVALRATLGGLISNQEIVLLDTIPIDKLALSKEELETYALSKHPLIIAAQARIARAKHTISYETSRIFDNVSLGVSYERDFEKGVSGVGPSFGLDIPLFNTNYGTIERAKYEKRQAERELFIQKEHLTEALKIHFIHYQSYREQIEQYEQEVIPPVIKGIAFSKEYFDKMQMSLIVYLDTQVALFQQNMMLLELQKNALREYSELEFAAGARLANITK